MSKEKESKKLTPVMQQYIDLKKEAPNAILMFRLGDFYECFFEDAITAAGALDIVLTSRGMDADGKEIPMCGIPWHAADNYFGRLVRSGHNVALAEQLESPEEAKKRGHKQIERGIVRVITPGTLTDETLLSPKQSNFLVVVSPDISDKSFHIAGCDISTGEFFVGETVNLFDEMVRLNPAEILYPETFAENDCIRDIRGQFNCTPIHERLYNRIDIKDSIEKYFPSVFSTPSFMVNTNAVALLAGYLENTQRGATTKFLAPYVLGAGARLLVDAATWRSLEIEEPLQQGGATLLDVLDRTKTSAGARRLRKYLRELSGNIDEIKQRQIHIGHFMMNNAVRAELQMVLGRIPDIGRGLSRLSANRGLPRDLRAVLEFLENLPSAKIIGRKMDDNLKARFDAMHMESGLADELRNALSDNLPTFFREGGIIKEGYDASLDNMNRMAHGSRELIAGLQSEYVEKTGVNTLKIKYNNILGYHIEVPAKQADKLFVPDSGFIHRQTMVGNVRFTTGRLIELDNEVRGAAEKAAAIEAEIVKKLIEKVLDASESLLQSAELLADCDVWSTLATVAGDYHWVRPNVTDGISFQVLGGRHPVVEKIMRAKGDHFVKNDCDLGSENPLDSEKRIALLTGPNMAGKSTYLRQNALIVVLAHLGSFVPADSATIGVCDQLFSRVGASDNLAAGQSTFMVEMSETANILNRATGRSFVIFDEIGRGTATFDGLSIAWAVLEFMNKLAPRTLFATHYHELTALEDRGQGGNVLKNLKCLTVEVKEHNNEIIFMHKIAPGVASRSYGIHVAKMAGMPNSVVDRAEKILCSLEGGTVYDNGVKKPAESIKKPAGNTQNIENPAGLKTAPVDYPVESAKIPAESEIPPNCSAEPAVIKPTPTKSVNRSKTMPKPDDFEEPSIRKPKVSSPDAKKQMSLFGD